MVSWRDVSNRALRKLGVLRPGKEATAAEMADAAASLQSFYMEGITSGMFGRITNVGLQNAGTTTANGGQHFNVLTQDAVSIDLPATVAWDYWCVCDWYGDYGWPLPCGYYDTSDVRVPPDRSIVMVTDQYGPTRATYIYDGTVQRWMRIDTYNLSDEAPLSARGPDGLASLLATRIMDEYGVPLGASTIKAAGAYKLALVSHHGEGDGHC